MKKISIFSLFVASILVVTAVQFALGQGKGIKNAIGMEFVRIPSGSFMMPPLRSSITPLHE